MINPANFSPLTFHKDLNQEGFHQKIESSVFLPVGERANQHGVEVYYIPDGEAEPDAGWMDSRLPANKSELVKVVKEAFQQYWGPEWNGDEMHETIIEVLSDERSYPRDSVDLFEKEGFLPFFRIHEIHLCREADAVVISGGVAVDLNLQEHGVSIMLDSNGVEFGYGGEFYELYYI